MNVTVQSAGLSLLAPKLTVSSAAQAVLASATGSGQYGTTLTVSVSVTANTQYFVKVQGADTYGVRHGAVRPGSELRRLDAPHGSLAGDRLRERHAELSRGVAKHFIRSGWDVLIVGELLACSDLDSGLDYDFDRPATVTDCDSARPHVHAVDDWSASGGVRAAETVPPKLTAPVEVKSFSSRVFGFHQRARGHP